MNGIVVIGTSWGGLTALSEIVSGLPADFPLPICIVQHRSKDSDALLVRLLQDLTPLCVRDAEDKETLCAGSIYIAPPDYHMLVETEYISLTVDSPVRFSRPSIDVLFRSAADTFGASTIGVVLTGANEDGAAGLARIVARGGKAIVQDPKTAESPIMPVSALRAVPGARVVPLDQISAELVKLVTAAPVLRTRKAG
jgi:two-component system, chemotaxis family, protein-glutamate methylesterase/glutaminase